MSHVQISLPVSIGEALDKYSILNIKKEEITDPSKLSEINKEIESISSSLTPMINKYSYHYKCLCIINKEIWDLTNCLKSSPGDNDLFQELFLKNDARFRIKSKLNKLTSSSLQEQKSYPTSSVRFKCTAIPTEKENSHIRYLSLCYDNVILSSEDKEEVGKIFADDPHIIVDCNGDELSDYDALPEPIPNLLHKYDFAHIAVPPTLNYICGGRLGDFIHMLYVVMCKYNETGMKGNVYITDDLKWGGDELNSGIHRTYSELYDIVISQPYVASFIKYEGQLVQFDFNLNEFRKSPRLFQETWLQIMSNMFTTPLLEQPWITNIPVDPKYKDTIIIHRSVNAARHIPSFTDELTKILKNNKCVFVTGDIAEYEAFSLRDLVPMEYKPSLMDMYIAINSCKFFIGNQSSPMAMAYSLFKPSLCESTSGRFYTNKSHYEGAYWYTNGSNNLQSLGEYIRYNVQYPFYAQFETDRHIAKYFPDKYDGICVDVGMAEPIGANNTYHFEQMGWKCLCIEPNPNYYNMGVGVRKIVENVACSDKNSDDMMFEIFTINGNNQGAISSLKRDDRLIQSHAHMISKVEKIPVKVRTLDYILEQHPEITHIDFISIDTENTELDVLKGFDINRWRPKLMVIENNYDEPFIGEYLKQFGYKRAERVMVNDFYVKDEYTMFHGDIQQGQHVDQALRAYFPNYDYKGVFIDVGAYEPVNISNSYHFEKNGWDVHCFEANTERIPELKSLRKNVYNYAIYDKDEEEVKFNVVHGIWGGGSLTAGISAVELNHDYMDHFGGGIRSIEQITVPQRTLNTVLDEIKIDNIDILSIDIQGGELKALQGLDLHKYKPKVVLIEDVFNNTNVDEYMTSHDYFLDKVLDYNKFYVRI